MTPEESGTTAAAEKRGKGPRKLDGAHLFDKATFEGNGRTCRTCHPSGPGESGTIAPADVERRLANVSKDPLFLWDGADTFGGSTFERLRDHATILVEIPLPPNVTLVGSDARSVELRRGVPTTMNTPALDPVLMYDGRAPSLQEQARGAIAGHAQSADVTAAQLDAIAEFELGFFNRQALADYAAGGPEPTLPLGDTLSERRGRALFENLCHHCHSGPLLNETGPAEIVLSNAPPGTRFLNIRVSEFNVIGNPVHTFAFEASDGTVTQIQSPDPGLALITGRVEDVGKFKNPILWGVRDTAPYFHDNSAKTIADVMEHYDRFFTTESNGVLDLSEQDEADLVAFTNLL